MTSPTSREDNIRRTLRAKAEALEIAESAFDPGRPTAVGFDEIDPVHRTRRVQRYALVAAAMVAVVVVATVLVRRDDSRRGGSRLQSPGSTQVTTTSGASGATGTTGATGASGATSSSTAPPAPVAPTNVHVDDSVRAALVAAFAAGRHLDPTYVAGTVPGSVYDAYDPATQTFWVLADFSASAAALKAHQRLQGTPSDPLVQFQDGPMVLSRTVGSSWKLVSDTGGLICPPRPPAAILALWSVGGGANCP